MKITCLSDIHGNLKHIDISPCDVVCICGDIVPLDIQDNMVECQSWMLNRFFPWCMSLDCQKVIFIWGNHDWFGENTGYIKTRNEPIHVKATHVMNMLFTGLKSDDPMRKKIVLLEDSSYEYNGVKFYGTSWCPDLSRWAFYQDHDGLVRKFGKIPVDTDVLLTHCPPRIGTFGTVHSGPYRYDYGCEELAEEYNRINPRLHVFGHVHTGSHDRRKFGNTVLCNVSILDEQYNVAYSPKSFDV